MKLFLTLFFVLSIGKSLAQVEFYGQFKPGSMVFIKSNELQNVIFDDKILPIDKGFSVIGFDRNEKGTKILKVKLASGKMLLKKIDLPKRKYKIQRINNMQKKYVAKPDPELTKRIVRERNISNEKKALIGKETKALFADGIIKPVKSGRRTSVFGSQRILNGVPKNVHNGVDYAAPTGTPVYAMAGGIIRLAADDFFYAGNHLIIDHGHGVNSLYLHLNKMDVKEGDVVKKGEKIGEIGTTGRSTGPHLHWGVQWYKKRVDPELLLKYRF